MDKYTPLKTKSVTENHRKTPWHVTCCLVIHPFAVPTGHLQSIRILHHHFRVTSSRLLTAKVGGRSASKKKGHISKYLRVSVEDTVVDASTKLLHLNDGSEVYHSLSSEASTIFNNIKGQAGKTPSIFFVDEMDVSENSGNPNHPF